MNKWNKTVYEEKFDPKPATYFTTPAYQITNGKLAKMSQENRNKILESLLKGNNIIKKESIHELTLNGSFSDFGSDSGHLRYQISFFYSHF